MIPSGVISTCYKLVIGRYYFTGSAHDEVSTIGGLTEVLCGQTIAPLGIDVAIEKLGQAFAIKVVAISCDNTIPNRLVYSCRLRAVEVFLEFVVCAKTEFCHLQIDILVFFCMRHLNQKVLVGRTVIGNE